MIDKLIVAVFTGLLAVILAMQLFLCSLPLFCRLEYDAICHKYTMLMDRDGGWSSSLAVQLAQDLNEHGFKATRIKGTTKAEFGGDLDLYVAGTFPYCRLTRDLTLEEVNLSLKYQSSTLCRILKSHDAVP